MLLPLISIQTFALWVIALMPALGLGVSLWVVGKALHGYAWRRQLVRTGTRTTGQVLGYETQRRRKNVRYFLKVQFTDTAQNTREVISTLAEEAPELAPGTGVPVLYAQAPSTRVAIADFWHLWFWPIFQGSMGGLMLLISIWLSYKVVNVLLVL